MRNQLDEFPWGSQSIKTTRWDSETREAILPERVVFPTPPFLNVERDASHGGLRNADVMRLYVGRAASVSL